MIVLLTDLSRKPAAAPTGEYNGAAAGRSLGGGERQLQAPPTPSYPTHPQPFSNFASLQPSQQTTHYKPAGSHTQEY